MAMYNYSVLIADLNNYYSIRKIYCTDTQFIHSFSCSGLRILTVTLNSLAAVSTIGVVIVGVVAWN